MAGLSGWITGTGQNFILKQFLCASSHQSKMSIGIKVELGNQMRSRSKSPQRLYGFTYNMELSTQGKKRPNPLLYKVRQFLAAVTVHHSLKKWQKWCHG